MVTKKRTAKLNDYRVYLPSADVSALRWLAAQESVLSGRSVDWTAIVRRLVGRAADDVRGRIGGADTP